MYRRFGKRLFDLMMALVAVVALLPVLGVTALLIAVFDRGPILFIQQRVGRDGREFSFLKFRSMPVDTGNIPSDQIGTIRLTWIGRLIRRTNLDELPQLVNVIRGEMSIVGPRPPLPSQTELLRLRIESGAISCRPGLTGLAQINAYDGMSVVEKAEFDGRYAATVTLLGDLVIIIRTFAYVLKKPPVY